MKNNAVYCSKREIEGEKRERDCGGFVDFGSVSVVSRAINSFAVESAK